jgi:MFS family permease
MSADIAPLDAFGAAPGANERPRPSALAPLLIIGLMIATTSATRVVFSPMQELAKADLKLSDVQVSLVQGLAASIPIALLSIPLGRLADRANRVRQVAALAAIAALGTLLTVFAHGFLLLFLARMLAGLGGVCIVPVAISLAADLSTPEQRGRSLILLSLGTMAGGAAGFAFSGLLLGALSSTSPAWPFSVLAPWRGVHLVFALVSGLCIFALMGLHEPARQEVEIAGKTSPKAAMAAIWRRRGLLGPLFVGQISVVMADTAAGIWAAPVLGRTWGLKPEQYAGWMGLVLLGAGLLGAVFGGLAADLGQKSRLRGGVLIGALLGSLLSIPASLFPIMPSVPWFGAMLGLLLLSGTATGLVTAAAIAVLVPNDIRGVCLGAFVVLIAIIGLGVAPTLVAVISDRLGGGAQHRAALAVTGVATSLASALGFGVAILKSPRDQGRPRP